MSETQQAPSKQVSASPLHSNIVLGIVMLGTLMGALDSTIVLLAFPTINPLTLRSRNVALDNSRLPHCHSRRYHTDGKDRRPLRQKQNIQCGLRDFHGRLSTMRFVTTHLPSY